MGIPIGFTREIGINVQELKKDASAVSYQRSALKKCSKKLNLIGFDLISFLRNFYFEKRKAKREKLKADSPSTERP
jgi:hypothetical protein